MEKIQLNGNQSVEARIMTNILLRSICGAIYLKSSRNPGV